MSTHPDVYFTLAVEWWNGWYAALVFSRAMTTIMGPYNLGMEPQQSQSTPVAHGDQPLLIA